MGIAVFLIVIPLKVGIGDSHAEKYGIGRREKNAALRSGRHGVREM
jgi:hypothetical protein